MLLEKLINGICDCDIALEFLNLDIKNVVSDSRRVEKGCMFVALNGPESKGSSFIDDAVKKGALVIVVNEEDVPDSFHDGVCYLAVERADKFLREISLRYHGNPSSIVKTIGITGTNGKTTTSYLIEAILRAAKKRCGVIGTVSHRIQDEVLPAVNTTPGFLENQELLSRMVDEKVDYCIMEVSSHALAQGRVDNIDFKSSVFTNLTQDHLDYHRTKENYFIAKAKLFLELTKNGTSIINADDDYGKMLIDAAKSKVVTYGIKSNANVMAKDIKLNVEGSEFKLINEGKETSIRSPLIGIHNIYNILAAVAVCAQEKIDEGILLRTLAEFNNVPGRLERIDCDKGFSVFIDYAHTEDALENVLKSLKQFARARIILVFGCGGDRDNDKRPKMGKVAGRLADVSIVTSDNPRSEMPMEIIDQILPGFEQNNYMVVVDRKEAILRALELAEEGDIVLLAGKGHEMYQIFGKEKLPFDEREIVRNILKSKK